MTGAAATLTSHSHTFFFILQPAIPAFSSPHPELQQVTSLSLLMHPFMFVRLLPWEDHVCLVFKSFNCDLFQIGGPGFRMFSDFKVLHNTGSICDSGGLLHVISIFHFVAAEECICNQMNWKAMTISHTTRWSFFSAFPAEGAEAVELNSLRLWDF